VLAYWGQNVAEAEIASVLGTRTFGTAISNVTRLSRWGYTVRYDRFDLAQLSEELERSVPVIVRLWTGFLDYWSTETSHVVVVIGLDETHVYLNDPAFSEHPRQVPLDGFLTAWAEYDETAITISLRNVIQ